MTEAELFRAAGIEPRSVAGVLLLSTDQLQRVLVVVEREGWTVLGLDGFELVEDGLRPDMDQIADWSPVANLPAPQGSARSVAETRRFLQITARNDRLYEVTMHEPE